MKKISDTERLDWLEKNSYLHAKPLRWTCVFNFPVAYGIRHAIDAAIRASRQRVRGAKRGV